MRIRWTVPAAGHLEDIKDYLQKHSPHLAEPTVPTVYKRIGSLKNVAEPRQTGTPCRNKRVRAYATSLRRSYVVVYSVKPKAVERRARLAMNMAFTRSFAQRMPKTVERCPGGGDGTYGRVAVDASEPELLSGRPDRTTRGSGAIRKASAPFALRQKY
jgi:plasmid stabilization system protein ParE